MPRHAAYQTIRNAKHKLIGMREARAKSATDSGLCSYCGAQGYHKDHCENPRVKK